MPRSAPVVAAVQSGRLTRQRIQASVAKLLAAKERLGLDRKRAVDVESIGDVVDDPAVNERAQEVADRAVTLVRNEGRTLPLAAPRSHVLRDDDRGPLLERRHDVRAGSPQAIAQSVADRARRHDVRGSRWTIRCRSCRYARNMPWRRSLR
ncbi:MAG: hypothetical protein WDO73_34270 [Ignavibacteriota bacterium]